MDATAQGKVTCGPQGGGGRGSLRNDVLSFYVTPPASVRATEFDARIMVQAVDGPRHQGDFPCPSMTVHDSAWLVGFIAAIHALLLAALHFVSLILERHRTVAVGGDSLQRGGGHSNGWSWPRHVWKRNEGPMLTTTGAAAARPLLFAGVPYVVEVTKGEKDEDADRQAQHLADVLARDCLCPAIPIRHPDRVQFLGSPAAFHAEILHHISRATRRIVIAALYIGRGAPSEAIIAALVQRLHDVPTLDIVVLLDYHRMHDGHNLSVLSPLLKALSTRTRRLGAAAPSIVSDSPRSRICLFECPSALGRYLKHIGRAQEVLGVLHTKILVFDNTLLLTGANLSLDYFVDRIDRYLLFRDCSLVAEWYSGLVNALCDVSHPLRDCGHANPLSGSAPSPSVPLPHDEPRDPFLTSPSRGWSREPDISFPTSSPVVRGPTAVSPGRFPTPVSHRLSETDPAVPPFRTLTHRHSRNAASLNMSILANCAGVDPTQSPSAFCDAMSRRLAAFAKWSDQWLSEVVRPAARQDVATGAGVATVTSTTWLFPTVQFARAGIHHDTKVASALFGLQYSSKHDVATNAEQDALSTAGGRRGCCLHFFMSSPYLNIYAEFLDKILSSVSKGGQKGLSDDPTLPASVEPPSPRRPYFTFLTCSTETNAWRHSTGFARLIPQFYLQLERTLYFLFATYSCLDRTAIREYRQRSSTFHAKGLWIGVEESGGIGDHQTGASEGEEDCILPAHCLATSGGRRSVLFATAVGSTNYGTRSVRKDVESEAVLVSSDAALRDRMSSELESLLRPSYKVSERDFIGGGADGVAVSGRFQPVVALVASLGKDFL